MPEETDGAPEQTDGAAPPDTGSILKIKLARRLAESTFVNTVGASMASVAVAFVAYERSKSLVLTVLVLAANALPALVLSPVVGRLTRYDARKVAAIGQATKVAIALVLTAFAAFGTLTYAVLFCSNLVKGVVSALMAPTWPAVNRMAVPDDRLAEFTGLQTGSAAVGAIVGALVGGIVVSTVGPAWTFFVHAFAYVPFLVIVLTVPKGRQGEFRRRHALRTGIETVRKEEALRRALGLATILNLAAWPVLSALPAIAHDIDGHAHVLGYLTGAFFAGAAIVAWTVARLRRRYSYGTILYAGFLGAGALLLVHVTMTAWREPGLDGVVTAALTLIPIGLAVSLNAALLQALVQLESPPGTEGPVIVVYATVTTVVAPLGGLLLGAAADVIALGWAIFASGLALILVALCLHSRFSVFDEIGARNAGRPDPPSLGHHWALAHFLGPEHVESAIAHMHLVHLHAPHRPPDPAGAEEAPPRP